MGMYTELHFNAELRRDVPQNVLDVLAFMVSDAESEPALPDHPLFKTERWRYLLTMDSYYFAADTHSTLRHDDIAGRWFLNVRSNLENYDNEIERFIDWIAPYVDAYPGDFLGFYRYEETEDPTLIRKGGRGRVKSAAHTECRLTPAWQPGTDSNLQRAGKERSTATVRE